MGWSNWKMFGNDIKFIGNYYIRSGAASVIKIFDASRNSFFSGAECENFVFTRNITSISVTIKKTGVYDIVGFGNGSEVHKIINTEIEAGQIFSVPYGSTAATEGWLIVNSYE